MKKLFFTLLSLLPLASFAQNATIKIDVDRKISDIDPKIYGVFMEPIHFNGRTNGIARFCGVQHALWKFI